jgi:hypothetical protein
MTDPEAPPPEAARPEPPLESPVHAPLEPVPVSPAALAEVGPAHAPVTPPDPALEAALEARKRDKWIGMTIVGATFLLGISISLWAKHASRPETSVPPGPPTTVGIAGFPYKVDVTASLRGARAVTKRNLLRGFTAEGVRPDGTIDLTEGPGRARYSFQSAPGQGPQPDSEVGPLPRRPLCGRQDVQLRHEGLVADPDQADLPCAPKQLEPLPDPQCSLATIWARALERGIRSDRLARIEYFRAHGGPAYRFEQQETAARFVLYGDCRRELKGAAAAGRVQ